jgi:periplasmic divalent cation tolerance protein
MTTVGGRDDADAVSRALVDERLAACVQALPIGSVYRWKGEVHADEEVLLLIKTAADAVDRLQQWVRDHHAYETPEFVVVPVVSGLGAYLGWVAEQTRP